MAPFKEYRAVRRSLRTAEASCRVCLSPIHRNCQPLHTEEALLNKREKHNETQTA